MTTKVVMPKTGMGIDEATIVRWLKSEGDAVEKGKPIAEIETAKSILEVESPVSGILSKILLAAGETANVNTDIAIIEDNGPR